MSLSVQYAFNAPRFTLRGWEGQGGVIYDDADSTLYEVSDSAFELLSLLQGSPNSQTSMQLAHALLGETPEDMDVALVTSVLGDLRKMGVVTCLSA
ncbi:MAG: hypothetical protein KBA70_04730 [Aquabacterium sp.]|jgi:hypothetical protein|uniref:hypothetical protein n=1 Tax=Aquabacterium sp. TaxID=1872578 RepID=UPI001B5E2B0A|nr:hypothetical protein [Aquabacterium sp.]MBP7132050.1 hypothetical protein [Aquabacterium sp.]MBP9062174.1 hypothetical protein [Aquabacterium sp.]MDQ5925847.1 hypothetical protein [Pseudomonadota bacterium]